MQATKATLARGNISTKHGQQRILKYQPDLLTYIKSAVKAGTYRTREEIAEMNARLAEEPVELDRIRWNVRRGSSIQDYPFEYQVMSLNPPPPFQPKMPKKYHRQMMHKYVEMHRPTQRLAERYLNRLSDMEENLLGADVEGAPTTSEEYYQRLLGAQRVPRIDSAMGQKSAAVNKAYAVAIKQNQLMRSAGLSEADALDKVEEMLKEDAKQEKYATRAKAETLKKRRVDLGKNDSAAAAANDNSQNSAFNSAKKFYPDGRRTKPQGMSNADFLSLLFSNDQRAFEGMISWTHRLQAVPYAQWTVGASTALDHWIAKRVLGMSEETWLSLLEGEDRSMLGLGRDIVTARHALFPETMLDADGDDDGDGDKAASAGSKEGEMEEIDELLQALNSWSHEDETEDDNKTEEIVVEDDSEEKKRDDKVLELTEELQKWRQYNVDVPFDKWSTRQKEKFESWIVDYVTTLSPGATINDVDLDATRQSLLSVPPQSKQDSDKFWDSIRDEATAEAFLATLLKEGPPDDATEDQKLFWQLPYSEQLDRIVSLGAIREIADEYTKPSERAKFLARYGDYLLEGIALDHLVPDPTGPIATSDINDRLLRHWNIQSNQRFRIEKIPYGTDDFGTEASKRARAIFQAWNKFKAGRAHYEEKLFQSGRLGLRYRDGRRH
mmetsp:Transcript_28450/g.80082  ORF Transcript_28450/g.80082 Transcript_28450/m.80082 type:complete len:667 (+) Transcript_28450:85-2085(+)